MNALLVALALAAPHASLQVYFQSNLAAANYQQAVFNQVAKVWTPPAAKPAVGKKAVVQVVLGRDGRLRSAVLSASSSSRRWDEAALGAIKRAAPFPPLPKDFAATTVEVHFHLAWEG